MHRCILESKNFIVLLFGKTITEHVKHTFGPSLDNSTDQILLLSQNVTCLLQLLSVRIRENMRSELPDTRKLAESRVSCRHFLPLPHTISKISSTMTRQAKGEICNITLQKTV